MNRKFHDDAQVPPPAFAAGHYMMVIAEVITLGFILLHVMTRRTP